MKQYKINRTLLLLTTFSFIGSFFLPISLPQSLDQENMQNLMLDEGQILYAPMYQTTTYLRDYTGVINHTWPSSFAPGVMVRWLDKDTIMRSIRVALGPGTGGAGGGIQKLAWDGTVLWDFRYSTNGHCTHHDFCVLPNGNVLLIAWETKTRAEAIASGKNPSYTPNIFYPDHIIEVQPSGPSSGDIVWEWHVWDHLVQDFDSSKANYGVVGDHPELVDINYPQSSQQDWLHTNSIDYNQEFDQIVISVRYFNEIWVIDHSTTKEEAASHTGGNSGKGGDLLYRWGNPQAYDRGTSVDRKLFEQHDTNWVDEGLPGAGNFLIFNNGVGRHYSTVDEITPPVDENGEYYLATGSAFGPATQTWLYSPQPSFYSSHLSGADRLSNGNTLVCNGETCKVFEVTPEGSTVWTQNLNVGEILKIDYIPPESQQPPEPGVPDLDCTGSMTWTNVEPGGTVNGSFELKNKGDNGSSLNWTINSSSIIWGTWTYNPESGINLTPEDGQITVQVSVVAPDQKNSEFDGYIRVENINNSNDFELVPVDLKTPRNIPIYKSMINQFLSKLINSYSEFIKIYFEHLILLYY